MATAPTSSESLAVASWRDDGHEGSKSDRYLARRLAAAGADYKSVAFLTFLLAASVAGIGWLLLGILLEHWVVPGGLPGWVRWAWLAVALVALVGGIVRWIVPLLRYRVNLVYAARAIEADHPDLHNDLVNAVLVKAHPEAAASSVVRTLERRAAKRLSAVPAEGVVDRSLALRLTVALAGLVAAACVYELAAPKSLLASAARLLAPWASLAPPTRVRIDPPQLAWRHPGADAAGQQHPLERSGDVVTVVRGRQLLVASRIRGLERDERAEIVVTRVRDDGTVDATAAPWRVTMQPDTEGRQAAALPDTARGLEHGIELVIVAGDAATDRVRVAVVDTPALLVREVRYEYPGYTRRPPETVAWQGDLRGVEGTRVTLVTESNRTLDTAWIDLGCDGKKDVPLRVGQHDLARATGSFTLRLNADRTGPAAGSYRLGFVPRGSGAADREEPVLEKLEHRIEVTADLAPEVTIEAPRQQTLKVPPDAPVTVRIRALDPDFAVARVAIETRLKGGETQPEIQVFRGEKAGVVLVDGVIVPAKQGAGPGSVLEYRAVAIDNRPEQPNVSRSPWRSLEIDPSAPPPPEPPAAKPKPDQRRGDAPQDAKQQDAKQEGDAPQDNDSKQGAGDGQRDQPQRGQGGRQQDDGQRPNDKPTDQQGRQQQGGQQQGAQQQQDGQQQEGAGRQEAQPQGGKQAGGQQRGGEEQSRPQQGGAEKGKAEQGNAEKGGAEKGGRQQAGRQQGDSQQAEQQPGAEKQGAKQPGGQQQVGERQPGEQPSGQATKQGGRREKETVAHDGTNDGEAMERLLEHRRQQQGECRNENGEPCGKESCSTCKGGSAGGGAAAGRQPGQGQSGQQQPGQGQPGQQGQGQQGQQGQGQQGQGQQGQGQQGQGQQGQGQQGQGQQGQGQQAAGQPGAGGQAGGQQGKAGADQQAGAGDRQGDKQGEGQVGTQPSGRGDQQAQAAGEKTGGQNARGEKAGKGGQAEGTGQAGDAGQAATGGGKQPQGNAVGAGGKGGGDQAARPGAGDAEPARKDMEWTEQDLANARNAADLALAHLKDAVNSGRTDVLDALGWTPEQARAFLERWEAMRRQADTGDGRNRTEFDRTLQSLGLRPDGLRSSRDLPADAKGGQTESRRTRPPADYRDQFRAFLQGTSEAVGDE